MPKPKPPTVYSSPFDVGNMDITVPYPGNKLTIHGKTISLPADATGHTRAMQIEGCACPAGCACRADGKCTCGETCTCA